MSRKRFAGFSLALGLLLTLGLLLALNFLSSPQPARAQTTSSSEVITTTVDFGWSPDTLTRTVVVTDITSLSGTNVFTATAAPPKPGEILILVDGELPLLVGDMYCVGPTWGQEVPLELTQEFGVPTGAVEVFGTIAPGPCWEARFDGATPGYESGDYPTPVCSWIEWTSPPAVVTVTVTYVGCWPLSWISLVTWYARFPGDIQWTPFCLVGEPDQWGNCSGGLYLETQECRIYLPKILRNY